MGYDLTRKITAEFVAMTLFVFVGCGTAVSTQAINGYGGGVGASFVVGTSMAFGTGIAVLAYTIAPVSGGHINPAVTTSLLAIGEIDAQTAGAYIAAQFAGAFVGALLVWGSMADTMLREVQDDAPPFLLGSNVVATHLPMISAFLIEFMGTFLLVWTVCMTAVSKNSIANNLAPIAIGWSVLLAHLVLIPFTGCGINPARSFGPHMVVIFAGEKIGYEGWWVYYTAPFAGGAAAAFLYKFMFELPESESDAAPAEVESEKVDAVEQAASSEEQVEA